METNTSPSRSVGRFSRHLRRNREAIAREWLRGQFREDLMRRYPNRFAAEAPAEAVVKGHLLPLVGLLAEYARTGNSLYRDLYREELLRYAPHRSGLAVLADYFREVLPAHEEAAVSGFSGDDALAWLKEVHEPLVSPIVGDVVRVITVGDCLVAQIQSFLKAAARNAGLNLDVRYYYFSAKLGVGLMDEGIKSAIRGGVDLLALSYLSYEGIPLYRAYLEASDTRDESRSRELMQGITDYIEDHLREIRELTDATILLHNASGLPLTRTRRLVPFLPGLSGGRRLALQLLNAAIGEIAARTENCILIDEVAVAERHGLRHCASTVLPRWIRRGADLHTEHVCRYLADAYFESIRRWSMLRKTKLLLVDFDNTLWSGVMAEGPVAHFVERQTLLKSLSQQGVLLAAVSKNDPRNLRWSEMALAESDFVALKIGWGLKVDSIKELASELNLGQDSFALIDDNPAELELVRTTLPGVICLDATKDESWATLEQLFAMPNTRQTDEARRRTEMYREQANRDRELRSDSDYPTLMAKLGLNVQIGPARKGDLGRLTELVQRTNQFNTTTRRYSKGELEEMLRSDGCSVTVAELSDKFGDLGIVAAAVVRRGGDEAVIENFVMSCRAMGFGMEQLLLSRIVEASAGLSVTGMFSPTARNEPASGLYRDSGFTEREPGEWALPSGKGLEAPPWISVAERN
jgi:FkbH-like protein